ncbi:hypothetical protein Leryth_027323 [Lithospermum erythrorhizon]|nr:hypothetical protein Leryth_027323 [Lithospermum erythrorhizon]
MGMFNHLLVGFSIGVLLCFLHGAFKNPEGLFLDENDAVSGGLVASKSTNNGGIQQIVVS